METRDTTTTTTEVTSTSGDMGVHPYASASICNCTEEDLAYASIFHLLNTPTNGPWCLQDHSDERFTVEGYLAIFADGKVFLPTRYLPTNRSSYTLLTVRRSSTMENNLAITILFPDIDHRVSTRVDLAKLPSPAQLPARISRFLSEYALKPEKRFIPRK